GELAEITAVGLVKKSRHVKTMPGFFFVCSFSIIAVWPKYCYSFIVILFDVRSRLGKLPYGIR
ncbi:MAG: hypothetical protein WCP55_20685, partial [Lentisphaerota bacterium]